MSHHLPLFHCITWHDMPTITLRYLGSRLVCYITPDDIVRYDSGFHSKTKLKQYDWHFCLANCVMSPLHLNLGLETEEEQQKVGSGSKWCGCMWSSPQNEHILRYTQDASCHVLPTSPAPQAPGYSQEQGDRDVHPTRNSRCVRGCLDQVGVTEYGHGIPTQKCTPYV